MRFQFGGWWQRRKAPAGFRRPHVLDFRTVVTAYGWKPKPLERWPDGWFSLWIGHWHFSVTFYRHRRVPDFSPFNYDNVP